VCPDIGAVAQNVPSATEQPAAGPAAGLDSSSSSAAAASALCAIAATESGAAASPSVVRDHHDQEFNACAQDNII
jgi:hypothetical protein